ncbi:C-type lectin domain family 6 member A-like [Mercenaria mercenaria]|uniref:C-type lectin domain family 6 member A-like n=1 Tax=Mercenaria mercenaria TaxID=6596 RepID=UPI00234E4330|nr:C-type lectin domain family 6 member A-like [Mercenaria mercenaria]
MEYKRRRQICVKLFIYASIYEVLRCTEGTKVIQMANFRRQTALDGRTCYAEDILFAVDVLSKLQCGKACLDTCSCVTIFYDSTARKCYGCNVFYYVTSPPPISSGNVHYQFYPSCDAGWTGFMRSCYKLTVKGSFFNGASQCEADGGHAVYIESAAENEFIKELAVLDTNADTWSWYIGVTDCEVENVWKYYGSDVTADYLDFRSPAPNSFPGTCCVVLYSGFDYQWSDFACDRPVYPWSTICEIDV